MEAGGLAVGILALAGLFNNAVDCFEYVQLSRNLGTNFQTSLLKLDNARLRLSRWGQAVGLSGDLTSAQSLQEATVQEKDIADAERVLGQILELFANAEEISARYKRSAELDDSNTAVIDVRTDMDALGESLHSKMRKLCIKRQNGTTLRHKLKWALYEQKHFEKLLEDIMDLVNALPEMFPATKQKQFQLCETEISGFIRDELSVLIDIVQSQDKDLKAAISAEMRSMVSVSGTQRERF
jgi:hypothetical protein